MDDHFSVHQYKEYIKQYLLQGGKIKVLNINGDMNCTQSNTFHHQYMECHSKGRSMSIKLVPPSDMYQFLHLCPRDPPPAPTNRLFPEAQVPASAPPTYDKEPWIGQYYDPTPPSSSTLRCTHTHGPIICSSTSSSHVCYRIPSQFLSWYFSLK